MGFLYLLFRCGKLVLHVNLSMNLCQRGSRRRVEIVVCFCETHVFVCHCISRSISQEYLSKIVKHRLKYYQRLSNIQSLVFFPQLSTVGLFQFWMYTTSVRIPSSVHITSAFTCLLLLPVCCQCFQLACSNSGCAPLVFILPVCM